MLPLLRRKLKQLTSEAIKVPRSLWNLSRTNCGFSVRRLLFGFVTFFSSVLVGIFTFRIHFVTSEKKRRIGE